MSKIYAVSDIHASISKYLKQEPKNARHIFILGDMFDKGYEQEETMLWLLDNIKNPKYTFLFGNHDVKMFVDVYWLLNKTKLKDYGMGNFTHHKDVIRKKNVAAKAVLRLMKKKQVSYYDIYRKLLPSFRWVTTYKSKKYTYIMTHASWEINKKIKAQNKYNLVFDKDKLVTRIIKEKPNVVRYAELCNKYKIKHIFGHYVCSGIFSKEAPVSFFNGVFNYIDNGGNTKKHNFYFMELE